jgi:hypothetical protein
MAQNHRITQFWQSGSVVAVRTSLSPRRWYRYATASRRRTPDFLIVGAQKAGTTSLWNYLAAHPQVVPPIAKEIGFFTGHFDRGLDWYRMFFPYAADDGASESLAGRTLSGESTAHYLFHPHAPARIAQTLPHVKLIAILRNPIDRAYSHYQMKVRRRQEPLSFDEAIAAEPKRLEGEREKLLRDPQYKASELLRYSYLARGMYFEQVERCQRYFSPQQLLIVESSELFRDTAKVYQRVLKFLGLSPFEPSVFGNRFAGKYSEKMSVATRSRLVDYFAPHNEKLYAHLGARFDWDR